MAQTFETRRITVLILVLVEYAFREFPRRPCGWNRRTVLILVLVEYAFRGKYGLKLEVREVIVLILVLVEYAFRVQKKTRELLKAGS